MVEMREMKVFNKATKRVGFVSRFDKRHGLVMDYEVEGAERHENVLPSDVIFLTDARIVDHAGKGLFEYDYIRQYLHGDISSYFYVLRFGPYYYRDERHIGFYLERVAYIEKDKEVLFSKKERESFPVGVLFENFNNSFYVIGNLLQDPSRFKAVDDEPIPEREVERFTI